ncbi:cation:proton antiporter [Shewanella saliphila]|uniref:Sodium:proton antiporter n=1 Tax=Shewanella saliphila TaxID=2282698 RepID=A0ABQ2QA03_9GAMM|nr:cation:proton antiporter [Shewanella saliphila]MCL1101811.1 cation:proton antiporter [Shewanella saliphila]GGP59538.1 sodium:proton antiporter [Shewanella saliphila]
MAIDSFVLSLFAMLVAGRLLGELSAKLGFPSVVGEVTAGIVIGPSLFNWVTPHSTLAIIAELGVILLLFDIGCETSIKRLAHSGRKAMRVALLGIGIPLLACGVASMYWLSIPPFTALFFGCALTATSIGISMRVLSLNNQTQSVAGHIILGAAVIDDIVGVILLSVLFNFSSSGEFSISSTLLLFAMIAAFIVLSPPLVRSIIYFTRWLHLKASIPGYEVMVVMTLICLFAWLAHWFGTPAILGGFAVGMGLSRQFTSPFNRYLKNPFAFTHKLEESAKPLVQLFSPIFFVYVGISLDISQLDLSLMGMLLLLGLTLIAVAAKFVAGLTASSDWQERCIVGSAMVPRGEVGLVFAEMGRQLGVIHPKEFAILVMVIALTTLIGPLMLKLTLRRQSK